MTGPVHLLANVRTIEASNLTFFSDEFESSSFAHYWTRPSWIPHTPLSGGQGGVAYASDNNTQTQYPYDAGLVLNDLGVDTSATYTATLRVLANVNQDNGVNIGVINGTFSLFARMNNTLPNVFSGGVEVRAVFDSRTVVSIAVYNDGSNIYSNPSFPFSQIPFDLSLEVTAANNARVLVNGTVVMPSTAVGTPAGQRFGFHINGTTFGSTATLFTFRRVDSFRVDYTGSPPAPNRNIVVALGGTNASTTFAGEVDLRFEDTPGSLVAVGTSGSTSDTVLTNDKARHLQAAELLGKLYIVGEDAQTTGGGGNAPIWVFNGSGSGSLGVLADESGFVTGKPAPTNCIAIAAWRNRLCAVSRDDQQNLSLARTGAPADWNYASLPVGSAVQLNTTGIDAGKLGEPINAIIPHSDDYLLLGCLNSMFVLRGDPTLGGQVDRLSSSIGIVAPQAWARGPDGETVVLSSDGLYALPPGVLAYPASVSREKLPNELRDIDTHNYRILMAYDVRNRGVFIGLTPTLAGGGTYFWLDWETRGFWPMAFDPSYEPTALVYRNADAPSDQRLLFGCRDGHIRALDDRAFTDDGLNFRSNLLIGPIALSGDGYHDGMIVETVGQTGLGSGDVTEEIQIGNSIEAAFNASPRSSRTLRAGRNLTHRPRLRGSACFIRLSSSGGSAWAYENMTIVRERLGKQRL